MRNEGIERDPELGGMLRRIRGEAPLDEVDWPALRRSIGAGAAPALALRRRAQRRRRGLFVGALATSVAALLLIPGAPREEIRPSGATGLPSAYASGGLSLVEILDADVTDEEFRTLLEGAADAEALLLLAAAEGEL
jgi:hypothetical protein